MTTNTGRAPNAHQETSDAHNDSTGRASCCSTHHQHIDQLVALLVKAMRELGIETISLKPSELDQLGVQAFDLYGTDADRVGVSACIHPHSPVSTVVH